MSTKQEKDRICLPAPLEVIEDGKDRETRSWKAVAWAPVVVGLLGVMEEVIRHFFK